MGRIRRSSDIKQKIFSDEKRKQKVQNFPYLFGQNQVIVNTTLHYITIYYAFITPAEKGLNELQEKYNTFHRERNKIFTALNEKVIAKRNKAYKACQEEVLAELKLEQDDIMNNDVKKEEIENLVMGRLDKEYVHAFRQEDIYAGTPIYKKRNEWIVFSLMGLALYDLSMAFLNCSFPMILLTSGIMLCSRHTNWYASYYIR